MNLLHKKLKFLLLMALVVFFASACAKQENENKPIQADVSNTLIYAGEAENTINPILNTHDELPSLIFSGLMKHDQSGNPILDLADDIQFNEETLTYQFHLKEGVKWHDGKPFTSEDVKFTYDLLLNDSSLSFSITSNYKDISKISVIDPYTVEISLSQYNAAMLDNFTIGLLPKHLCENQDVTTFSFNQNPVGTGKFRFVSWDRAGGNIILESNQEYYDKVPSIERVVYKTVSVESTKALMLQSGEADLAWLNAKYAETFRGMEGFQNIDFDTADYRAISPDFKTEFWIKNKNLLPILNLAIDKEAIVKSVLNQEGFPAFSPMQLSPFGTDKDVDPTPYDLGKFAEKMEALGWQKDSDGIYEKDGEKCSFTIQVRDYEEERVEIANIVSSQLRDAGVLMDVILVTKFDWNAGYGGFLSGNAVQFDPDALYKLFVTDASDNTMRYSNKEIDRILEAARQKKDPLERKKLYEEFEISFAKDPAVIPVVYLEGNYVGISGISGFDTKRILGHHAVGVLWNIEDWTLNKKTEGDQK